MMVGGLDDMVGGLDATGGRVVGWMLLVVG